RAELGPPSRSPFGRSAYASSRRPRPTMWCRLPSPRWSIRARRCATCSAPRKGSSSKRSSWGRSASILVRGSERPGPPPTRASSSDRGARMTPLFGMITVGQAPRVDVVPDMVEIIGPGIRIREVGALDGLSREAIAALAPAPGDDILVTRLADGQSVFVAKRHVVARVQACVDELEAAGVAMTAIL